MDDLRKVELPALDREGWPREAYVAPLTIDEFDQIASARETKGMAHSAATTVALRARRADGSVLWGKGILPEWRRDRGLLQWLFRAATAINESDAAREAEEGN